MGKVIVSPPLAAALEQQKGGKLVPSRAGQPPSDSPRREEAILPSAGCSPLFALSSTSENGSVPSPMEKLKRTAYFLGDPLPHPD